MAIEYKYDKSYGTYNVFWNDTQVGVYEDVLHGKAPRRRFSFENYIDFGFTSFDCQEEEFKEFIERFCPLYLSSYQYFTTKSPIYDLVSANLNNFQLLRYPPVFPNEDDRYIVFITDSISNSIINGMKNWLPARPVW